MSLGLGRSDVRVGVRNERLFREAMRKFTQEVDAVFAHQAAIGLLKSGATIKKVVRALDETTAEAINNGLAGIAAVTEHNGRKRKRLIEELTRSLGDHHAECEGVARIAIERIGLGSDVQHAVPIIETAKRRHHERIADFAEGWTAPPAKLWKDRHPILFAILLAAFGAMIGVVGKEAADGGTLSTLKLESR